MSFEFLDTLQLSLARECGYEYILFSFLILREQDWQEVKKRRQLTMCIQNLWCYGAIDMMTQYSYTSHTFLSRTVKLTLVYFKFNKAESKSTNHAYTCIHTQPQWPVPSQVWGPFEKSAIHRVLSTFTI